MEKTNQQTVIVTGGGTGIGYAVAEQFVRRGANVFVNGRTEAKLRVAAERLGEPARVGFLACDITLPTNADKIIEAARNQTILRGQAAEAKPLWLRSEWGLDGLCRFSYSTDGKTFATLGEPYRFGWTDYRGERIGLFSYNNNAEAGHADFGLFTYRYDSALTR